MIISVSRRTDIPAFYTDWFFNRVKEGYVLVRNPMNPKQVSKIILTPNVVDCFVFWTKNPATMIDKLTSLDDKKYKYYFQFTLNAYSQDIEKNVPLKKEIIETFVRLSEKIGKNKVIWRYDPIILTNNISIDYHVQYFEYLASKLKNHTRKCVISFLDFYKKCQRNLKSVSPIDFNDETKLLLASSLQTIAKHYGIILETCSEDIELSQIGIQHGKCIDDNLIGELCGGQVSIEKDKTQREACGCVTSIDIGSYNTCKHECLYCYANFNQEIVERNVAQHNTDSPLIFGEIGPLDKITERVIKKKIDNQKYLF